jgi:HAD superfamily hydrolase (TIGR01509 family)
MNPLKTALFDFDGVIVDTEPVYDRHWSDISDRYDTGIEGFADLIKGTTLPEIIDTYFSNRPKKEIERLVGECVAFESSMPLPAMPGSIEFLRLLKSKGVQMGLVTSSDSDKVQRAVALHHLENLFDTIVTSERVARGKPDPACYLLAAADLKVSPADCLVFEDSLNGIRAGQEAGMKVIALSTTHPAELLRRRVDVVISDFRSLSFEQFLEL